MVATAVAVVLWLGAYLWYFLAYNHLVALRNTVSQSWSHVDVELQRRFDLISNLVTVVKGYAQHEAETLVQSLRARQQQTMAQPQGHTVSTAQAAAQQDRTLLGNIMVLVERYPQLKADQQFTNLQTALIDTENRIATRRSAYNECVSRYGIYCHSFPSLIPAWAGRFPAVEFFDAQEESAHAIRVLLS